LLSLIHSGKVSKMFPALDPLVMDLIPYTDGETHVRSNILDPP